jgi:hypothetical protein
VPGIHSGAAAQSVIVAHTRSGGAAMVAEAVKASVMTAP